MDLCEIEEKECLIKDKKRLSSWQKEIKDIDNKRMEELVYQFINENKDMTLESADLFIKFLDFCKNK